MSGNDPNNPNWNNNQGWGNQGNWQQPNQQQQAGWDEQQQQQQQQQQWGQQGQQQGGWDQQQQYQQQQAGWDQQQQQWNQQQPAQQQWNQQQPAQQQQWGQPQQAQSWEQQQQAWGAQQGQGPQWQQPQAQASSQPWQGVAGYGAGAAAATAESFTSEESDGRSIDGAVATLGVNERVSFIKKTYAHLAGAILFFLGIEWALFKIPVLYTKVVVPFTVWSLGGQYNWAIVLGGFMCVSWMADKWASSSTSRGTQYMGLIVYSIAEAITFIPLIAIAQTVDPNIPAQGFVATVALFAALTAVVFVTRKDFSFMKGALALGSMVAMGMIVGSIMFGFSLGVVFSAGMCLLAGGYILYYTSKVLAHYHPQQYVAAALALFAAFMLLLWYVIRILISMRR